MFRLGSSEIDWCEANYQVNPYIAEYFNTDYANYVNRGIYLIWGMLIGIGFGSVYFHATLSMVGQLMDELFILYALLISYAILFPSVYLPRYFQQDRQRFVRLFYMIAIVITMLCCYRPYLNAYFLMMLALPIMTSMYHQIHRNDCDLVVSLGKRTIIIWLISVICWVLDRVFCDFWISIDAPYLHSVFHVLVFLSSYTSIVLFAYFHAVQFFPNLEPRLTYWPQSMVHTEMSRLFALPYIKLSLHTKLP